MTKDWIEQTFIDWHQELISTEDLLVLVECTVEDDKLRRECVDHICETEAEAFLFTVHG